MAPQSHTKSGQKIILGHRFRCRMHLASLSRLDRSILECQHDDHPKCLSDSQQDIFDSEDAGVLSDKDFNKLDKLIAQTSQFSEFLTEQMKVKQVVLNLLRLKLLLEIIYRLCINLLRVWTIFDNPCAPCLIVCKRSIQGLKGNQSHPNLEIWCRTWQIEQQRMVMLMTKPRLEARGRRLPRVQAKASVPRLREKHRRASAAFFLAFGSRFFFSA